MNWWDGEYGMGFGIGGFFKILFWVPVILWALYLMKTLAGGGSPGKDKMKSTEDVLRKRFAGFEISKEEFQTVLEVLKKSGK